MSRNSLQYTGLVLPVMISSATYPASATGSLAEENGGAYAQAKETVMAELRQTFRPEFLNRIDDIIVFRALTEQDIDCLLYTSDAADD